MREKLIFSMGHSTRKFEEFINIIKKYSIKNVVDVRRFPGSRKFPHFAREFMEKKLSEEGINYFWLGEFLGGKRKGEKGKLWSGYLKHMETVEFKKGLETLVEISEKDRTLFLCAERMVFKCHRRFIAKKLIERGFKVIDIVDEKKEIILK